MTKIYLLIIIVLLIIYFLKKWYNNKHSIIHNNVYYADDVTKMNKTHVNRIYYVQNIDDIVDIIELAKINNKQVIPRGQTHTMGGQTIVKDGYIIDMKFMNHILNFDESNKLITIEPGATWSDLINYLNDYGLSPMTLQSYSSFSIGGTLSVNAHGITNDTGLYNSIVQFKLINPDGKIITCNREQNNQLFGLVIGGYGLFGIIIEITLKVTDNVKLSMETINLNLNNFDKYYTHILEDSTVNIKLARINITNMHDISLYIFRKLKDHKHKNKIISNIDNGPHQMSKASQLMYKWIFPNQTMQMLRYDIEKMIGKPLDFNSTHFDRNQLLYETAEPLAKLYNPLINLNVTHILQEYFVPKKYFIQFVKFMKNLFIGSQFKCVTLLNITIRFLIKDNTTFLNYATQNMYAFVLYYRCELSINTDKELQYIHNKLVDYVLKLHGTFYLPYRHHYNFIQLMSSYPQIIEFIKLKKHFDPTEIFSNLWYEKYKYITEMTNTTNTITYNTITYNTIIYDTSHNNKENKPYMDDKYNFNKVFESITLKKKLKQFLQHIFYLLPYDKLYSIIFKIINSPKSDITVFNELKKAIYTNKLNSGFDHIKFKINSLKLLKNQQKTISAQLFNILTNINHNSNIILNGYVSIGDPGYYIDTILSNDNININAPYYILHDKKNTSYNGKFINFDYGSIHYNNIANKIDNDSVDLLTCFIGLHHFTPEQLDNFLKMVYNMLRINGLFIIREHNAYNEIVPLIYCAHTIFNAVTDEPLNVEKSETRLFKPIIKWRKIVEQYGFVDLMVYDIQPNDPTENIMICFKKISNYNNNNESNENNKNKDIPLLIRNDINKNYKIYNRSSSQTYHTLPEWLSVDIIKEYGKFLEHTPWYNYPYFQNIYLYWSLTFKETNIIKNKFGFKEAYCSSYILMNVVIGIVITIIFTQLALLSIIPRLVYGSNNNNSGSTETDRIHLVVYNTNNYDITNFSDITIFNKTDNYYYIDVPRYKKFTDILLKFIINGFQIIEIAGQKNIQAKILIKKKDFNKFTYKKIDGCEYLFKYNIIPNEDYYQVAVSIKIIKMHSVIINLISQNIIIDHIFDF